MFKSCVEEKNSIFQSPNSALYQIFVTFELNYKSLDGTCSTKPAKCKTSIYQIGGFAMCKVSFSNAKKCLVVI